MEELKLLIEMVKDLPALALWVVVFFFIYKVVFIGTVFGVIQYIAYKLHDWAVTPQRKDITPMLDGMCIRGTSDELKKQLKRIIKQDLVYIHPDHVTWLQDAIDAKIKADKHQ